MWNFTRIGPKTKKLWLSIVPVQSPSEQPGLGTTPKRCELQLFLAGIRQALRRYKAIHLGRLNMQFQQDWLKDKKNYSSFNFLAENLEKISLNWALCSAASVIENFSLSQLFGQYRNGKLSINWVEYFSRAGRKTKKLPRSKLFLSMAFKHGLLQGSTFLFQYSSMTRAPLESSRLGELKYAISPG